LLEKNLMHIQAWMWAYNRWRRKASHNLTTTPKRFTM